jgi:hypothetical protein
VAPGTGSQDLKIGDTMRFVIGDAEFATLLHNAFYVFDRNRLAAAWPMIGTRGMLQSREDLMCWTSRAVRSAASLAVVIFSTVGLAADGPKQSSTPNAVPQKVAGSATLPTEQECRDWAALLEKAVNKGNAASCNDLLNWDALLETATAYPNTSPTFAKHRSEFISGAKSALRSGAGLVGELLNAVRNRGSYKFLRCRDVDGRRRAEFRMITSAGALNYHEFVLAFSEDGLVRAVDCYVFLTGQLQSEALREAFLPFAQRWSQGGLDQLPAPEKDFVSHYSEFAAIVNCYREKEHRRLLEIYKGMPDSLKKMKTVLAMRLRSAQSISDEEYLRALDDYRKYYPNDASIDLIAVDAAILRKSYDNALTSLDRVDKSVGGDPYLKVLRANVLQLQQKSDAAGKMAEAAIAEEPTLIQAYYSLLDQSLRKRNFARTAELLSIVESKFNVRFKDLTTVPVYAEFVKSDQYKAWLKSHGGEE